MIIFYRLGWGFQGRSKNVWESPMGCLLFSFTIQMEDGRIVPHVQYVVSLAMTAAINDVCQQNVSIFRKFYMHLNQVQFDLCKRRVARLFCFYFFLFLVKHASFIRFGSVHFPLSVGVLLLITTTVN